MKKILVACIALTLATHLLFPVTSQGEPPPGENNGSIVRTRGFGEGNVLLDRPLNPQPQNDGNFIVEVKKGMEVALRAHHLRMNNKGFAKAYADMIRRGGKPLFAEWGVTMLGTRVGGFDSKKVAFGRAPSVVDGQYEVSFLPFFTGNQAVWEGLVYVSKPEGQAIYAIAHDVIHADPSQTEFYYETYYPPDGGPPLEQMSLPNRRANSFVRNAALSNIAASPMFPHFPRFFYCVAGCFMSLYVVCLGFGPAFWACMAGVAAFCILACSDQL